MINATILSTFSLSGLNDTTIKHRVTLFSFSLLCYIVILLVNGALIVTIILEEKLHEPMYIFLCNLCVNSLYGTAAFYPKFLFDLLSNTHVISYTGCLLQVFVIYSYAATDFSTLALMAYDRHVAICRPLEYHSIMSKQRVLMLVCFSWIKPFCIVATNIFLTSRLKLCSPYIARLFCVNWVIVKLACFPAQTTISGIAAYITIIIYVFHSVFIVWSYMYLIKTCVNSVENRAKFMQTCVPHLISLLTFLVTLLFDVMNMRFGLKDFPQTLQNVVAVEFLVIPPIMNPLIYGFKLTKIRTRILGVITCQMK